MPSSRDPHAAIKQMYRLTPRSGAPAPGRSSIPCPPWCGGWRLFVSISFRVSACCKHQVVTTYRRCRRSALVRLRAGCPRTPSAARRGTACAAPPPTPQAGGTSRTGGPAALHRKWDGGRGRTRPWRGPRWSRTWWWCWWCWRLELGGCSSGMLLALAAEQLCEMLVWLWW